MNTPKLNQYVHYFVRLLHGPATYVFGLYVRQALMFGVMDLAGAVICALAAYIGWKKVVPAARAKGYQDGVDPGVVAVWLCILTVIGIGLCCLFCAIPWLFNPQWSAIQMILQG